MRYAKGVCWIGDCRIPFVDVNENTKRSISGHQKVYGSGNEIYYPINTDTQQDRDKGRFTPNLLVCDDLLNDGVISKSGKNNIRKSDGFNKNAYGIGIGIKEGDNNGEYGDKGTNSRYYDLDTWFNKVIDEIR